MTWNYAYTPYIWPLVIAALLLLCLSSYSWRHRHVPGVVPFSIGSFFSMLWVAGYAVEIAAVDPATKIFWFNFQAAWIPVVSISVTCFILEYVWPGRWLTRLNLTILVMIVVVRQGLILTNNLHHLMWLSYTLNGSVSAERGPAALLFTIVIFTFGLLEFVALGWLFVHSPQHRWPVLMMLIGIFLARVLWILNAFNINSNLLPDVFSAPFVFVVFAIAIFSFRIFDPVQMARRAVIEQLHAGMIVLDLQGRIISLNPAAEQALGVPANAMKGRLIFEFLPGYRELTQEALDEVEVEFQMKKGQNLRLYTMTVSRLKDWRGLEAGRLLVLRDVTEQRHTQAQILAQQRALAILNERERMARELHDSLGQVLAYAGLQLDTVAKLSRDNESQRASEQLDRLSNVIREAHSDLRETILILHSTPSPELPFFKTLQQYLQGFTDNYNIKTHLQVDPEIRQEPFTSDAKLQVFRIIQEALSNARKHGKARHVQVSFTIEGKWICMIIQDDGQGFLIERLESTSGDHFGLKFMQERAAQLDGKLKVESVPRAGTRILLELPVKEL